MMQGSWREVASTSMKIIFDFDDVIFNTRKFLEDYKRIFASHGVSASQFDYPLVRNKKGKAETYSLERHLEFLGKEFQVDVKRIKKGIAEFIKQNRNYVFRDAIRFLEKFPRQQLYLLSYADYARWQNAKIKSSGISQYFKKVIICSGTKSKSICQTLGKENISKEENIFFIDDRLEHIEDVKKCHPEILTILLKRKEGRYNDRKNKYCDYEARDLRGVEKIIRRHF